MDKSYVDEKIKLYGYKERETDLSCNYIVYENKEEDTEVTIQWGDEDSDCMIFVNTISEQIDFYGNPYNESLGLTCKDYEVFNSKIQKMRKTI